MKKMNSTNDIFLVFVMFMKLQISWSTNSEIIMGITVDLKNNMTQKAGRLKKYL